MFLIIPTRRSSLRVALPQFDGFIVLQGGRCDDVLRGMARSTQDGVGVTLETLDNLFTLQVPDVDHVVLAARDDPLQTKIISFPLSSEIDSNYLATGNREVGEDAVPLVLMARVGLQALPFRVVPQL